MFAKIINDSVEKYPYQPTEDYPLTSFQSGYDAPEFNVYWVHPSPQNNPDPTNLNAIEDTPIYDGDKWVQGWAYVEKTDEQKRQEKYNPGAFLTAMFSDANFAIWMGNFTPFQQSGIAAIATNAKIDNDWATMQATYDQLKSANAPSQGLIDSWQGVAENYGIPLIF
jgi:hypothetical protein